MQRALTLDGPSQCEEPTIDAPSRPSHRAHRPHVTHYPGNLNSLRLSLSSGCVAKPPSVLDLTFVDPDS
ncbi:uncharacterized protein N7511_010734 [Penicillium nucicola]|uniref:uncharacterized protein n=1 Tax=Penicillium nucicola TaxID=1850975 RepID=UPI00254596B7|nr:uncharacterized protein N7511_010734 [Penicillium nucicola]KAJ5749038.1 hypothetical protein N7511_010734 [Penicillium nucicola]